MTEDEMAAPVFLPGESQGLGNLVGCRLWGCTESDNVRLASEGASTFLPGAAAARRTLWAVLPPGR